PRSRQKSSMRRLQPDRLLSLKTGPGRNPRNGTVRANSRRLARWRAGQMRLDVGNQGRVERPVGASRIVLVDPLIVAGGGLRRIGVGGADGLAVCGIALLEHRLVTGNRIGVVEVEVCP